MKINFSINEEKLIRLFKKGDVIAQFRLYKLYSKAMYNVALRITGKRETAEDVLQDSFYQGIYRHSEIKKRTGVYRLAKTDCNQPVAK